QAKAAVAEVQAQLSHVASYVHCPEYKIDVLKTYLSDKTTPSRVLALHLIALDNQLRPEQRRKLAWEMIQHKLRDVAPLTAFVDQIKSELGLKGDPEVEPEHARWYRDPVSDNPVDLL